MKHILGAAAALAFCTAAILPVQAFARVGVDIVIGNAPPPVRYEVAPAPRRGYEWAPGFWNWNGRRHVWIAGHWERVHVGQIYEPAIWVQAGSGWQLRHGGWRSEEHAEYRHDNGRHHGHENHRDHGDQDHDGIPNQRDHDRDGDGIPNRYDHDRDGDGVPNEYDRSPNDRRRD